MATLLDIAQVSESVQIPGKGGKTQEVEVFGVSAEGVAVLFHRFPEIRMLMTGKSLDKDKLAKLAPAAIAAVIAASTGHPGDKKAEAIAARLPLECQMDILDATVRLTMPGGMGPFVERLQALAALMGASENTNTVADTKSPSLSST